MPRQINHEMSVTDLNAMIDSIKDEKFEVFAEEYAKKNLGYVEAADAISKEMILDDVVTIATLKAAKTHPKEIGYNYSALYHVLFVRPTPNINIITTLDSDCNDVVYYCIKMV